MPFRDPERVRWLEKIPMRAKAAKVCDHCGGRFIPYRSNCLCPRADCVNKRRRERSARLRQDPAYREKMAAYLRVYRRTYVTTASSRAATAQRELARRRKERAAYKVLKELGVIE